MNIRFPIYLYIFTNFLYLMNLWLFIYLYRNTVFLYPTYVWFPIYIYYIYKFLICNDFWFLTYIYTYIYCFLTCNEYLISNIYFHPHPLYIRIYTYKNTHIYTIFLHLMNIDSIHLMNIWFLVYTNRHHVPYIYIYVYMLFPYI